MVPKENSLKNMFEFHSSGWFRFLSETRVEAGDEEGIPISEHRREVLSTLQKRHT